MTVSGSHLAICLASELCGVDLSYLSHMFAPFESRISRMPYWGLLAHLYLKSFVFVVVFEFIHVPAIESYFQIALIDTTQTFVF